MGPPSYMRSVVDQNVVMRRIPVFWSTVLHWGWCMETSASVCSYQLV